MKTVFITGGTGYMGTRVIRELKARGYPVMALVRNSSQKKIPEDVETVIADPFDTGSFQNLVPRESIFIQLLGVPHPSPKKAPLFKKIDLSSLMSSVNAARYAGVSHFIYVSVAMEPSTIMKAYQEVRKEGEAYCIRSGLKCTFIRPWYVLGPGHWWPVILFPIYFIARFIPSLQNKAAAFGLVTIHQMVRTLVRAVESDPIPLKIFEIADIKRS